MSRPALSTTLLTFSADDPGSWNHLIERTVAADRAGLDRIVLPDHVVFGEQMEAYGDPGVGGTAGGRQPTGPDGHWLEPLTTMAYLAARTERIRFGTGILLAALRRPVVLAKMLANIDVLSGGRVDLGVGVGWQREEYDAAGLDFGDRGAQLDHTLEVCRTLWSDTRASYADDRLRFDGIHMMPKPTHGRIPIWVSGTVNSRSMRRLARFGDGWIPWGADAADLAAAIPAMRAAVEAQGRDPTTIEVVANLSVATTEAGEVDAAKTLEPVPGLVDAGVTDFRAGLRIPYDAPDAESTMAGLVTAFRAEVGR